MTRQQISICCYLSLLLVSLFLDSQLNAQEIEIVFPAAFTDVEGPLDTPPGPTFSPSRIQVVFSADEFSNQLPETHRYITGFRWRPDSSLTTPDSSSIDNVVMRMSTTNKSIGGLSNQLSDNIGSDETTVYEGPLTLSTMNSGPSEGPKDFDMTIAFQQPFEYDPAAGNLLLDYSWFSPFASLSVDECCADGVQYSQWVSTGAGFPLGDQAIVGGRETTITQFIVVPEPSSTALCVIGLLSLVSFRRRR